MARGESCTCSALTADCCQATNELGFHSLVCLPLRFRGDYVGAGLFGLTVAERAANGGTEQELPQ